MSRTPAMSAAWTNWRCSAYAASRAAEVAVGELSLEPELLGEGEGDAEDEVGLDGGARPERTLESLHGEAEGRVGEGGGLRDAGPALRDLLAGDDDRRIVGERHRDRFLPREVQRGREASARCAVPESGVLRAASGSARGGVGLRPRGRPGQPRGEDVGSTCLPGSDPARAWRPRWSRLVGRVLRPAGDAAGVRAQISERAAGAGGARGASARQLPLSGSGSAARRNSAVAVPASATWAGACGGRPDERLRGAGGAVVGIVREMEMDAEGLHVRRRAGARSPVHRRRERRHRELRHRHEGGSEGAEARTAGTTDGSHAGHTSKVAGEFPSSKRVSECRRHDMPASLSLAESLRRAAENGHLRTQGAGEARRRRAV